MITFLIRGLLGNCYIYSRPNPIGPQRFAHWSGFPRDLHLNSHFPERELVQKKVMKNETRSPGAVHHFEYLGPATAIIGMSQINSIWSCHDLEVDRYIKRTRMRQSGREFNRS